MLTSKDYRSLAVAKTDGEWSFVGIISLSDPPHEDSRETISTAKSMGVDFKMTTGDHASKEICWLTTYYVLIG